MKLSKCFAMAAIAAGLMLPTFNSAEAANVALLPLINNVIEREDLGAIYYDRAVEATKMMDGFDIVESAELDKAVEKNIKANSLPDQVACQNIASEANVDYIVMMQVDQLEIDQKYGAGAGDYVILKLRGRFVSYDAINNKFVDKRIMEDKRAFQSQMARYDISGGQFGNSVTRETKRALNIKKFKIEKPRIGNLKGNKR